MIRPLALTMGEPAGISAEITLKAWMTRKETNLPCFFSIDDPERLSKVASQLDWPVPIAAIDAPEQACTVFEHSLPVLPEPLSGGMTLGNADSRNVESVIRSIERAVEMTQSGTAGGVITNPIHKKVMMAEGFPFAGHTDYLASLANSNVAPVMMLMCPALRVIPLTVHKSLLDSISAITVDLILETTRTVSRALQTDFALKSPHIAITGLNPHAGEGGLLGREEIDIIEPAVEILKKEGISVRGPVPADTLFHERAREGYDVAICMYHDQALIPLKTLDFYRGVNVTLGLPFIRTSPDHGTAFEIAGTGVCDERSLVNAIITAGEMAARRRAVNLAQTSFA